jgi:hypothetical protein
LVDLALQIVRIELLDRTGDRAESRQVLPSGLGIEATEPAVLRHQTGRARGSRIEMILEIQVGPAEVVYR